MELAQGAGLIEARERSRDVRKRLFEVQRRAEYAAESASQPGYLYRVVRERDGWRCDCLGFYHRGYCRHVGQLQRRSEREHWSFGRLARVEG